MSAIPPDHAKWDANGDFRAVSESKCSCALCADYRNTAHYPATPGGALEGWDGSPTMPGGSVMDRLDAARTRPTAPTTVDTVAEHLAEARWLLDAELVDTTEALRRAMQHIIAAVEALAGHELIR